MRLHRAALLTLLAAAPVQASDHSDAPIARRDPAADITDVYAWMSPDGQRLNLIMNVAGASFSDAAGYVFHIESMASYGDVGQQLDIVCVFDASQNVECWAGQEDHLRGPAFAPDGLPSDRGRMRIFTGRRNDPFFFNAEGFDAMVEQARGMAPMFDQAGCLQLGQNEADQLTQQIRSGATGGPPFDTFEGGAVSSIVLSVERAMVTSGGAIVAVWGSTHAIGR